MKQIEKYIQFAIDNGYNLGLYTVKTEDSYFIGDLPYEKAIERRDNIQENENREVFVCLKEGFINTIELITSKPFIEAVARGIEKKLDKNNFIIDTFELLIGKSDYINIKQALTVIQGIVIRDNKLPEFIDNLLK